LSTNSTGQKMLLIDGKQRSPATNSGLAKWRVTCFYDTFVVKQTVVLLMNFSAKNPPLRQAAKRYLQLQRQTE
jgi:hypothetical protein